MRTARHTLAALALGTLVVGLASCSADPDDDTTTSSPVTEEDLEGAIPTSGWWCRMIEEELVDAATEGAQAQAREVVRQNDEEGHLCEVVLPVEEGSSETETVMAFQVQADAEDAAEQLRAEMEGREDVTPGPDFLGDSFVVPGAAYTIVPCGAPLGSANAGQLVPYVLSMTTNTEAGQELTEELTEPLRRSLVELDQSVKCSPKAAQDGTGGQGDDDEATSAP